MPGGDDERRVGDHQVKTLPGHGLQQAAQAKGDARLCGVRGEVGGGQAQPLLVQEQIKAGEGQCTDGNVRGDDALGVLQQVEELNAAPRPDVQGTVHSVADGPLS